MTRVVTFLMEAPRPSTSREESAVALRDLTREGFRSSSRSEPSDRAVALTTDLGGTDVKVLADNCFVHVGTRNELTYNFSLNVGDERRDGVRSTVRQCLEGIKRDSRPQEPGNSSVVFTGKNVMLVNT